MANTIVAVILPAGWVSHVIKLYQGDALVNTSGGDALTPGSNNTTLYTATVTEAVVGDVYAEIENAGGTKRAAFVIYGMADDTGTYVCQDPGVASVSGTVDANLVEIGGVAQSATDLKDFADTGYNPSSHKTAATIAAGDMATDSVTAAAIATDAATKIFNSLTAGHTTVGGVGKLIADNLDATVSSRAAASLFTGITSVAQWLGLIAGKQTPNSTALTEIKATGAGSGTYDATTDSLEGQQDNVGTAGAGLTEAGGTGDQYTAVPWNADWDAQVQSEVVDALQETVPDSIPADGTRPNIQQALYIITQMLTEFSISGTTLTVKKPDGSTTLLTLTLSDATNPTALTRAS